MTKVEMNKVAYGWVDSWDASVKQVGPFRRAVKSLFSTPCEVTKVFMSDDGSGWEVLAKYAAGVLLDMTTEETIAETLRKAIQMKKKMPQPKYISVNLTEVASGGKWVYLYLNYNDGAVVTPAERM